ncbi:uncharacterized protein LOC120449558 [Drosophila santomea]|uniref:uncharacterized protein LOC120449558 n=1 Tax=Drosophila santomea TaxID=129105 RepID=UPI001952CC39|nr:uncharacterized protein LOC120449558 [Drosophila santomea]
MESRLSASTSSLISTTTLVSEGKAMPRVNDISSKIKVDPAQQKKSRQSKAKSTSTGKGTTTDFEQCRAKILRQQRAELLWRTFTDEEYSDWETFRDNDYQVPLRSVFSYVQLKPSPGLLLNVPPKKPGPQVVAEMMKGNHGALVRIRIGEHRFRCIPSLLKCFSGWFGGHDWRVTRFTFLELEVPARGFEVAYEWMRTEKLPAFELLVPALQVARHLGVSLLEKEIWRMLSGNSVREKSAFLIYLEAKPQPALGELCEMMVRRLRRYFLALVGSPHFLQLQVEILEMILRQDTIGVNSEMEVFFAVLRWLGHSDDLNRLTHMGRLMKCVRFHHMPMTFLFSLRESCNRPDKKDLFRGDPVLLAFNSDSETMVTLERAISFIGVRSQYEDIEEFLADCGRHHMDVVYPRRWVYHIKCPYHLRSIDFPYQHRFTASEFRSYIASIQKEWDGGGPADHGRSLVIELELDPMLSRGRARSQ